MYDVAIVGGGPAGIAAAVNVSLRKLSVVMFRSGDFSQKLISAKAIPNYPGMPDISGEALANAFENHLRQAGISPLIRSIDHIYPMGDYYALTANDEMWEARSVILTTGVMAEKQLKGEEALVGRGVSYCATCDGMLYKGGHVVVLGYDKSSAEEAEYLSKLMRVTYLPLTKEAEDIENAEIIRNHKPLAIEKAEKGIKLITDKAEITADCAFIFKSAIAPGTLLMGLDTSDGHVNVKRDLSTNLPGVFAAGDVTGLPYQIAKAVGEGATAGLSASRYINQLKNGTLE